jgi:glycine/D-amino acid oxidase-like deaminating enzyme
MPTEQQIIAAERQSLMGLLSSVPLRTVDENVIIASPCSGHGFKHSAAIGEVLSQLVTTGKSPIDISRFSIQRLEEDAA